MNIHFAALLIVPDSLKDPLAYYQNNTSNSRTLIAAAVRAGVNYFIFSSTAAVYGTPEQSPVSERSPLLPISPYGSSKLMTETMLRDTSAAHEMSHVSLRYFNVAGADPHQRAGQSTKNATHLIKVAAQVALGTRRYMEVYGTDYATADGTCIRDYIHVSDLVRVHLAALTYLRAGGKSATVNCGYGHGYSVLEVIEAVNNVVGRSIDVRLAPRRAGDPPSLIADIARIQSLFDWHPTYDDLNTIVRHALAWERRLPLLQ